jgi:hypothetical protein
MTLRSPSIKVFPLNSIFRALSVLTELSQLGTSEPVKCFGIRRGQ